MSTSKLEYLLQMVRFWRVYDKYRDATLIKRLPYIENLLLIKSVLKNTALAQGALIECGTWKGGMSAGMIEAAGPDRKYIFFDSFEGLPPVQEIDGERAKQWQIDTETNCAASLDDFKSTINKAKCPTGQIEVHKGFFEASFPDFESPSIAVLRLDGDWYSSTMICLEKFWDHVMPGGLILIDDYHTWDGCSRAVHDFLSSRKAAEHVGQGPLGRVSYIRKR